jgi:hypothetical protein
MPQSHSQQIHPQSCQQCLTPQLQHVHLRRQLPCQLQHTQWLALHPLLATLLLLPALHLELPLRMALLVLLLQGTLLLLLLLASAGSWLRLLLLLLLLLVATCCCQPLLWPSLTPQWALALLLQQLLLQVRKS